MEIQFGPVTFSVFISVVLRLIYNTCDVPKRLKPWLAIAIGMVFGVVALYYTATEVSFVNITNHLIMGFMTGSTAIGLYEVTQKGDTPK